MFRMSLITLLALIFVAPLLAKDAPHVLQAGRVVEPPPMDRPDHNTPFTDPVFGSNLIRVSNRGDEGGYGTHIYSQLQAFSVDNEYLLMVEDGFYVIRSMEDFSAVDVDTSSWNAPRWHPTQPGTVVHYDSNDDTTVRVQLTRMDGSEPETIYTFPSEYTHIRNSQSFDEISRDGAWMGGMLTRDDGVSVIFALNLQTATLGAVLPIDDLYTSACTPDPEWGIVEPDWIGVSPLGRYLVVQWVRDGTARCSGLESFDPETGAFIGRSYDGHQHGDLGLTPDGEPFFMTFELASPEDPNRPAIAMRMLPGTATVSEPIFLLTTEWGNPGHISCQGPAGVCLVSNSGFDDDIWLPYERELLLLNINGRLNRLAHHRSSECDYWTQPRGTISADGRYVAFTSDWMHGEPCSDGPEGDVYILDRGILVNPRSIDG